MQVTVMIRSARVESGIPAEALRMSLGLTLTDNRVRVVLIQEGVSLLSAGTAHRSEGAEIARHIRTLGEVGCEVLAEEESLAARGLNLAPPVRAADAEEIQAVIRGSDRVIVFSEPGGPGP